MSFRSAAHLQGNRSRRVVLLMLGVVVLSIADLAATIQFLRGQNMIEANPLAAYLMQSEHSELALGALKLTSLAIFASVLFCIRRRAVAEAAAWCGLAILVWNAMQWQSYSQHVDDRLRFAAECYHRPVLQCDMMK